VVFYNQERVPDFSGWETCSPSISINEFGLLDGVLKMRSLINETLDGGGGGSGSAQYDVHYNVETFKYCIHNGKYYKKRFTADERHLVSTMMNMRAEVWSGAKRRDLGWISRFDNDGSAVIYSNIKEEGWKFINKLPDGVTNVPQI
jgi:hypothetical protein